MLKHVSSKLKHFVKKCLFCWHLEKFLRFRALVKDRIQREAELMSLMYNERAVKNLVPLKFAKIFEKLFIFLFSFSPMWRETNFTTSKTMVKWNCCPMDNSCNKANKCHAESSSSLLKQSYSCMQPYQVSKVFHALLIIMGTSWWSYWIQWQFSHRCYQEQNLSLYALIV